MPDVTVTAEAIANMRAMFDRAEKAMWERDTAVIANIDADMADVAEAHAHTAAHLRALLTSLLTALELARQAPNGRVYADLDGLEFVGVLHGGVVDHGNGDVRVHT